MFTTATPSKRYNFSLNLAKLISIASVALLLLACEDKSIEEQAPSNTQTKELQLTTISPDQADTLPSNLKTPLTQHYLSLASEQFQSTCANAEQLQASVQLFLSDPNEIALKETRQHWLSTHNNYAASKLFRALNIKHPVLDHSQIDPVKHSLAIRIDQSPLLPGYLDAIEGYPQSGYVFSPIPINKETLNKEHQFSDTLYVTLGFHSIEFLLWGEGNEQTRKSTDYATLTGNKENSELAQDRRSQLLSLTTKLLAEDLQTQCKEWLTAKGYYPSQLRALPEEEQNEYIIATMEQLLHDIQINSTQIKNATELHSAFAHSDVQDLQAQIKLFKSLLESKEWKELSKKQERAKKITKSAKALLQ